MNNQIQKLIQTFKHSKVYIKWFKFMRHRADSSLNHHDCNKKQTIDLDKILTFSLLLFFLLFLAFRECWLAKPILFQPTRKFKTSHLDKAKNYLENTDFEIVFSESIQIRFSSIVRRHVCLSGQPWLYFFKEILFTDVEYLSMKVKIDSCTYHTDRLHTMNPIDHHILASSTS